MSLSTSITVRPQVDGTLQVSGHTEYGEGRTDHVEAVLTKEQYETMREIARTLANSVPKMPGNSNPDGSNIFTAMQLAILKLRARGSDLSIFNVDSEYFNTARKIAFDHQMHPHPELVNQLVAGMTVTNSPLWTERLSGQTTTSQHTPPIA